MRDSLPLFLIALDFLYFGFYLQLDWLVNHPVSRVNYEMIRIGMPLTLVESIMDGLGEYGDVDAGFYPTQRASADGVSPWADNFCDTRSWTSDSDTHRIAVFLDSKNRVIGKAYLCRSRVNGVPWLLDRLPLWIILLAETAGLSIFVYLILTWLKRFQRHFRGYTLAESIRDC